MHGRLKVRSTEEQSKARQEEQTRKLLVYNEVTAKAFLGKRVGKMDKELLKITSQVLLSNPDFYTLWNMRKETFLVLQRDMEKDDMVALFQQELGFLEECLKSNPKSYGSWHHRCFVMDSMNKPDWKRELILCNSFLQSDERNFHCWDYRRYVVRRSGVSPEEEYAFTSSKICANFSNFSSWHYRSKLLPIVHPAMSQPSAIDPEIIDSEFKLVQNGLYTDPDDQSNWFYYRWLLGRGENRQEINYFCVSLPKKQILVSFVQPIKLAGNTCQTWINKERGDVCWLNQTSQTSFSTLWIGNMSEACITLLEGHTSDCLVKIEVEIHGGLQKCQEELLLSGTENEKFYQWSAEDVSAFFRRNLTGLDDVALAREVDVIQDLQAVEPDNKWVVLTLVLLMKASDPSKYQDTIFKHLHQLQTLDSTRSNYYLDIRSRFIVELALAASTNSGSLSMTERGLSTLYHVQLLPLVCELNLSHNHLLHVGDFAFLQSLQRLNLASNQIASCYGLHHLRLLSELNISDNRICSMKGVEPLKSCNHLHFLDLSSNPLSQQDLCAADKVRELLPMVSVQLMPTEYSECY